MNTFIGTFFVQYELQINGYKWHEVTFAINDIFHDSGKFLYQRKKQERNGIINMYEHFFFFFFLLDFTSHQQCKGYFGDILALLGKEDHRYPFMHYFRLERSPEQNNQCSL